MLQSGTADIWVWNVISKCDEVIALGAGNRIKQNRLRQMGITSTYSSNINIGVNRVVAALTIGYVGIWLRQTTHTTAGVVSPD
jgi:hypothetical protein